MEVETLRLLEAVKPYPILHSLVLESLTEEEWMLYVQKATGESNTKDNNGQASTDTN